MLIAALSDRLGPGRTASAGPLGALCVWPTSSGIEVAAVEAIAPSPKAMIDAWRAQRRGRAKPLLLLVEAEGELFSLGPEGTHPPPVPVSTGLLDALELLAAPADLQEIVERVRAMVAEHEASSDSPSGIRSAGLFTPHYLFVRLPRTAVWPELESRAPKTIPRDWHELLADLGYSLVEVDDGYVATAEGEEVAVVRAHDDPGDLDAPIDDLDDLPYRRLGALMRRHRLASGLLVSRGTVRLFAGDSVPVRLPERYLEMRLDRLEAAERPFLGVLAPGTLGRDAGIRRLLADARQYGVELKEGVEQQIRDVALPALVRGLVPFAGGEPSDPQVRHELTDAAMTMLFRMVFLLYAESADFLPVRSERYGPHSLTRLATEARRDADTGFDETATGLWDGVRALVNAIRTGNEVVP